MQRNRALKELVCIHNMFTIGTVYRLIFLTTIYSTAYYVSVMFTVFTIFIKLYNLILGYIFKYLQFI